MQQNQMMQYPGTQNAASPAARTYRIRTLKIFGGIQIGMGILCGILSLVGVVIDGINMNKYCSYYICRQYRNASVLFGFNMTCLIFSGWNLLTGIFPFCMNQKRRSSWRCLKITFMVCSILGASFFMPTVLSLGVVGALMRANHEGLTALPVFLAIMGLTEMVVAIVAASYCCCCSSFETTDQPRTVYITTNQPGMALGMAQTQIPNGQIQVPLAPPVTIAQTGGQPMGVTAQQYLVPGTHTVMYQVPTIQNAVQATNHQMQAEETNPPPYKE